MNPRWIRTGFGLQTEPFQWDGSLKGEMVVSSRNVPIGAFCALSVQTSAAREGQVWTCRHRVTPGAGILVLRTEIPAGTWTMLDLDAVGGPQEVPRIWIR